MDMINKNNGNLLEMCDPEAIINHIESKNNNTSLEFLYDELKSTISQNIQKLDSDFDKIKK